MEAISVSMLTTSIGTALFFMIISELYEITPLYRIGIHLVIASAAANILVLNLYAIKDRILLPIANGQPSMILTLIIGVCFLFIFTTRYRPLYRMSTLLVAGMSFGIAIPYAVSSMWGYVTGYATGAVNSWQGIFGLICFVVAISYWIFGSGTNERITRPLRSVARAIILTINIWFLPNIAINTLQFLEYQMLDTVRTGTWWIPLVMFGGILVYHFAVKKRPEQPQITAKQ
jgi:hypothetical protein